MQNVSMLISVIFYFVSHVSYAQVVAVVAAVMVVIVVGGGGGGGGSSSCHRRRHSECVLISYLELSFYPQVLLCVGRVYRMICKCTTMSRC